MACLALPSRPSCFVEAPSAASLPLQTDAYGLWVFFIPGHKELQTECNVDKRGKPFTVAMASNALVDLRELMREPSASAKMPFFVVAVGGMQRNLHR